jgi:hypothetical protein
MNTGQPKLLGTADAGRYINRTPDRVRQLERAHVLPAIKTTSGMRLFRIEDLEEYVRGRAQRRGGGGGGDGRGA